MKGKVLPGPYEVACERDVPVIMRDGVRLFTDLYLPAEEGTPLPGPWPAVMTRTAYNKDHFEPRASFFASHGYLSVVQDVRGTFKSEGEFFPFVAEADDGCDMLDWLVAHPRCNGKIGTYGCSYMGLTQLAMATRRPRGLACMIPFGTPTDIFHGYVCPDGGYQLGPVRWVIEDVWGRAARDDPETLAEIQAMDFGQFAGKLPWRRGKTFLARSPHFEDIVFTYLERRTFDDFWKQPGQCYDLYFENFPDIPILWVSGWYDGYPRAVCEGYGKMSALGRQRRQHILLGPWIHNQMSGNTCGDADFGPNADVNRTGIQLAFFDRWLKGDAAADIGARVRVFLMGGGSGRKTAEGRLHHGGAWLGLDDWPPPGMQAIPWHLHPSGGLSPKEPDEAESSTSYTVDPDDPVPSIAPPWLFPGHCPKGPADLVEPTKLLGRGVPGRPLADRPDVCVFQSEPLEAPLRLLGPLRVKLFVSSDAPDTDFAAKLVDVYPPSKDYPNGYAYPVCEGLLRMSCRESDVEMKLMEPGRIYQIEIECFPAANLFAAGHRVRLDIASSNFPRYEINRHTGDPFSPLKRVAHNTIHHDAAHPSHVLLPILEGG